ncbi:hypothetical protein [Flavobacterium hibernum]|uniref:Uncharacterized protein n=1 Tax=Flavobacterium hibernum TaxID=37752 RepID=A0A0D0EVL7_9FLAO|nr:hypothetical protein [Flavobacterium hibernum]KIO50961.1 hypothetical protein IW18_20470 [Flavobacterium hibernum]OXA85205.1 hypothetical protein B0A73_17810 [Flavobacterium hibernum]STO11343.1 Uncharacterised protein [Flavobacterium hibernum]
MFGNRLIRNLDFLKEFIKTNDLTQNFTCNFDIKTKQHETYIDCEALITFDSSKREVEIIVSANIDTGIFPISFQLKKHQLDIEYDALIIYGKNPTIGLYKAIITPYENI